MHLRTIGKCSNVNGHRILQRMFWLEGLEFNLLCLASSVLWWWKMYRTGRDHNPNYCHSAISIWEDAKIPSSLQVTGSPQFFVRKIASLIPNVHHLGILCDEPKSFLLWFQLRSTHLRHLLACLFFPLPIHCCPILRGECKVEGEVWPCPWPEGIDHGGSNPLPEALQRLHPPQPHPSLTLARTGPAGILVVSHHALELGRQP